MCDTLCVRHPAGMWFAKNSDRHRDETQVVEWHPRRASGKELHTQYLTIPDSGGAAFIGSRPTWLWGCEHGVNEYGVAIGNQKIFTVENPRRLPAALVGMDIVRLVLERARSADDALDICTSLLERHGQGGSGEPESDDPYFSSFLVVDARGGWVVETSNRTWAARPVGDGASISNRVSLSTDWTRASADVVPGTDFDTFRHPKPPLARADHRLAVTGACVARGFSVDQAAIAATLRDHSDDNGSGFSVCVHRPEFHAQTTASMIVDVPADGSPPRVWACLGNPCTGVYIPMFLDAVPPELAAPHTWERFAQLRDLVDAGALALARVRAALDPVEADLRVAAAAIDAGDSEGVRHFAACAFAPVNAALTRLGV
jgi:secernin